MQALVGAPKVPGLSEDGEVLMRLNYRFHVGQENLWPSAWARNLTHYVLSRRFCITLCTCCQAALH